VGGVHYGPPVSDDAELQRRLEVLAAQERDSQAQVALLERRLAEAEGSAAEHEVRAAGLAADLRLADAEIARLREEVAELRRVYAEAEATAAHLRTVNEGLMTSVSWRITRPLRALKPDSRA